MDPQQHEMDPHEQAKPVIEILQKLLLWPKGDNPDNLNYLFFIRMSAFYIFLGLPSYLTFAHICHYRFVANYAYTMTVDLTVVIVLIAEIIIFILYACNLKLLVGITNLYQNRFVSLHSIRVNYKMISRFIRYFVVIALILLGSFVQWDTENCEKRKILHNSLESCGLFFPIYLPFEYDYFPLKQYILIHQGVELAVAFNALIHMAVLMLFAMVKQVGILDTLIRLVDDFDTNLKNNREVTECLRTMVNTHQFLICFNRKSVKVSRYMNMTIFVLGGSIMATSIVDVITTGSILPVVHGSLWIIAISLIQTAGQIPINKSLDFERALYNTRWYKLKKSEDRTCFLLLLQMSQKPVAFYAGPTAEVSFPTLLALFKAAYSGTTMLIKATKAR